ncbi:MAG: tRNA (adenosine(37)-N6)-threonylcarbamoyltransferase complex ATPase subunit type 1 TsaE [Burkholderiales bacterium]|nr:tRNA (adenosine(37)-N6)-threonylcarbamoyltransferase complex ATPase subunit type 1 TsaE [Burkholderiales bacterium]
MIISSMTTSDNLHLHLHLADEAATLVLGSALANALKESSSGALIYLSGDLGAGKTTLSRGILRALGFSGRVKSPTYTLVELYVVSKLNLYHFDFYRFGEPEEWQEAGFRDLFNETNICLVEWPEKAGGLLPPPDLTIAMKSSLISGREAHLAAHSPRGLQMLSVLTSAALPTFAPPTM